MLIRAVQDWRLPRKNLSNPRAYQLIYRKAHPDLHQVRLAHHNTLAVTDSLAHRSTVSLTQYAQPEEDPD